VIPPDAGESAHRTTGVASSREAVAVSA
jgi:hypothetical protein